MIVWRIFANACTAAVTVLCIFTHEQYKARMIDMIIIGMTIYGVINKIDDIRDKLDEK